jgi:serine/threonine protein kinase
VRQPENILLRPDGQIKLSDFGLSRTVPSATYMKTLCGTPQYLAPEIILQSEGKQEPGYTLAVDLWSMGVILYILLAGFPPFAEGAMDSIKNGNYDFDDERWDPVSDDAKDMIRRLMTVDPKTRATIDDIFAHSWMKGQTRVQGDSSFINAGRSSEAEEGSGAAAEKRPSNGDDANDAPAKRHKA